MSNKQGNRTAATNPPRIEYLKVQNFRALREVEFKDLTPLKVLLGPNGSGKSTVFDVKDAPFSHPVLARFASDGTLEMLAYLVLLHDPNPPPFIGIEEPENFLHPRLLPELAEECRAAIARTQLLATSHSPFFVNALRPEEVRVLWRDEQGFTQAERVADIQGVPQFVDNGALLGHLWM